MVGGHDWPRLAWHLRSMGDGRSLPHQPGGPAHMRVAHKDIRRFFYLFQVLVHWRKYLRFNKIVDDALVTAHLRGKRCV